MKHGANKRSTGCLDAFGFVVCATRRRGTSYPRLCTSCGGDKGRTLNTQPSPRGAKTSSGTTTSHRSLRNVRSY